MTSRAGQGKPSTCPGESVADRLAHALVHGVSDFVLDDTEEARRMFDRPIEVIEGPLMDGMNIVGDLSAPVKCFCPRW